ncbi:MULTISPECIES: hypothetical protein [Aerosakkonema]
MTKEATVLQFNLSIATSVPRAYGAAMALIYIFSAFCQPKIRCD